MKRNINIKSLLTYCLSILFFQNLKITMINFEQYNSVENNDHSTKLVMIWKFENEDFLKLKLIEQTDFDFANVFKNRISLCFFWKHYFVIFEQLLWLMTSKSWCQRLFLEIQCLLRSWIGQNLIFTIFDAKTHQLVERITITNANKLKILNRLQRTQKKKRC